jgi:proline iminopeptidase
VLLDLRGQGQSDRAAAPEGWTLPQMAADVSAVAAALGAERYAVLGHSFGAFVALQHAVNHPGAAAASIVCCGLPSSRWLDGIPARLDRFEPPALREQIRASWAREESVQTEAEFAALMHEQLPWHFADPQDRRLAEYEERSRGTRYAPAVLRAMAASGYGGLEVEDRLGAVTSPTLLLAGRHDRTCPPEASEAMAAGIRGAALHVFEASGHMPFVEQPEEFLEVVQAFLGRVLTAG